MSAGRHWIVCFWSVLVLWLVHPPQAFAQGTPPSDQPLNEALATNVTVRVVGHGSLVLGREVGGARVTITDLATGRILASGLQQGEAGDQNQIMRTPHYMREPLFSTSPSASYSTTLYLTHPTQVEITAEGPLSYPAALQRVSETVWLIPGQHMTGDGIVLQLYGYIVQIMEPKAGDSLIAKEDQPLRVSVRTLAGTPVRPHGDWDSRQVHIYGEVVVGNQVTERLQMFYSGEKGLFESSFFVPTPKDAPDGLMLRVVAVHATDGNMAVGEAKFPVLSERLRPPRR
ncbi:MAG: hypothetical protein AB7G48_13230 [Nitrospiraceae bacterium]